MADRNRIEIPLPDDWHLHLRDGDVLPVTVNHAASRCRRAIIMPNLKPPVRTVEEAAAYRDRILQVCQWDHFEPLMTLYLTDNTSPEEILKAKDSDFVHAVKLYPAGATTNSDHGLTSVQNAREVFAAMEQCDFPLLVHAESTEPNLDVFDRERAFVETDFAWICENFKKLRIVFEHVSSRAGVDFVNSNASRMAATVTPHHLLLTRNDLLVGGLKPHHYCLPVVKTEDDRRALIQASLDKENFFAGTDSAPHPRSKKESHNCAAGIYTAPFFPELYAMAFEPHLPDPSQDPAPLQDFLRLFMSVRGERFYRMPLNEKGSPDQVLEIRKEDWTLTASYEFAGDELVPLYAGKTIPYKAEIVKAN